MSWRDFGDDDDRWNRAKSYGPRQTGWGREKSSYWSEDPLLAWKGACPHPKCQCEVWFDHATGSKVKRCANDDCPWSLAGKPEPLSTAAPEASRGDLAKRFGGLEYD